MCSDTTRRKFARRTVSALLVVSAVVAATPPVFAADIAHGAQLARQWCVSCHLLPEQQGQTALQGPPSFRDIARSGKTPDELRVFLMNPHGAMPPLTLSRAEIDDLVAYIETLH